MGRGSRSFALADVGLAGVWRSQPAIGRLTNVDNPSEEDWQQILAPWAADWDKLSKEALDSIIANAPQIYQQLLDQGDWGVYNCNLACQFWLSALDNDGIEARIIGGHYHPNYDPDQDELKGDHTWLEIDGQIVDPTAGQFAQGDDFSFDHYLPQHYWDQALGDKIWQQEWPAVAEGLNQGQNNSLPNNSDPVESYLASLDPERRQKAEKGLAQSVRSEGRVSSVADLVMRLVSEEGYDQVVKAKGERRLMNDSPNEEAISCSFFNTKALGKYGMDYAEYLLAHSGGKNS